LSVERSQRHRRYLREGEGWRGRFKASVGTKTQHSKPKRLFRSHLSLAHALRWLAGGGRVVQLDERDTLCFIGGVRAGFTLATCLCSQGSLAPVNSEDWCRWKATCTC